MQPSPSSGAGASDLGHVLVVGGTGMLRGAALDLARRADLVTVIARTAWRVERLRDDALPRRIEPVALDWSDTVGFEAAVIRAANDGGPFDVAVAWVHSSAKDAPPALAEALAATSPGCRLFLVVGSRDDAEQAVKSAWHERLSAAPGIVYRRVRLGRRDGPPRRWLTDEEISRGVVEVPTAPALCPSSAAAFRPRHTED